MALLVESNVNNLVTDADSFFQKGLASNAIQDVFWVQLDTSSVLPGSRIINFSIPALSGAYVYDLSRAELKLKVQLELTDGGDPKKDANVAFANNFVGSLFETCKFSIENNLINGEDRNYSYTSYLLNHLSFDYGAKSTWLAQEGYTIETGTDLDNFSACPGFEKRKQWLFSASGDLNTAERWFQSRLPGVLNQMGTMLPPGISCKLELNQHTNAMFYIDSEKETNFAIKVKMAQLFLPRCRLIDSLYVDLMTKWSKDSAKVLFHFRKYYTITEFCNRNSKEFHFTYNLTSPPSRVYAGFVRQTSYDGAAGKSAYNFIYNLNLGVAPIFLQSFKVRLGGREFGEKQNRIEDKHDVSRQYMEFNAVNGAAGDNVSNYISYEMYKSGNFLLAYDFSAAQQSYQPDLQPLLNTGILDLNFYWSAALSEDLRLILLLESPQSMGITHKRQVLMSYSV